MIIKKYISIIAIAILILVGGIFIPNKASAATKELTAMTVAQDKIFTITFNNNINRTTVNNSTIKVLNSLNQEINIVVTVAETNNKVITIKPPNGGYVEGSTYILVVNQGIMNMNNALALKEGIQMKFSISNPSLSSSVFDSKDIAAMCNYSDLSVKGSDITLKDYDDFGKTTVKPTYTIPTAYMPNLSTNYYAIANTIINPQMYTSLGYGDKKRRVRDYDRVVLDYSETKDIGLTNFAFIYQFYTDNEPYNDCQKTNYAGLKPIGFSEIGNQFLDATSITSFYKTNKILFGDNGSSISDEIVNNYKIHANDIKQFSATKDFGKIRVNQIYMKDDVLISFFEIVASQEVEIAPMIANPVTAADKNEEKTFEIYKASIFKGIAEKKTSITIDYSGGMEDISRDTDMAVVKYILGAIYANPHETIGFFSYCTNGSMTSMYIDLGYRY